MAALLNLAADVRLNEYELRCSPGNCLFIRVYASEYRTYAAVVPKRGVEWHQQFLAIR